MVGDKVVSRAKPTAARWTMAAHDDGPEAKTHTKMWTDVYLSAMVVACMPGKSCVMPIRSQGTYMPHPRDGAMPCCRYIQEFRLDAGCFLNVCLSSSSFPHTSPYVQPC